MNANFRELVLFIWARSQERWLSGLCIWKDSIDIALSVYGYVNDILLPKALFSTYGNQIMHTRPVRIGLGGWAAAAQCGASDQLSIN